MKKLNLKWMYALAICILAGSIQTVNAQEHRRTKVEIKSEMSNGESSIHVKMEREDGGIYENSYSSKEEMENDPELKDLYFGDETQFLMLSAEHQDGRFDFSIEDDDGDHNKVLMFKSEDGATQELHGEDNIWLEELKSKGDNNFLFKTNDGELYQITRDGNGGFQIERNGQPVDLEELKSEKDIDINMDEDGLMVIREGDRTTEINMDNGSGSMFLFDGDKAHSIHENGEGNKVWFYREENGDTGRKLKDGNYTFDVDVQKKMDDEGNEKVIVRKILVVDLKGEEEISKIPGIHLNEGGDLGLEDINFYPNPSTGHLSVKFRAEKEPTEVKIIDMMGREVFRENLNEFNGTYDKQIDLSDNDPGIYILQVIQNNRSLSKKIMLE